MRVENVRRHVVTINSVLPNCYRDVGNQINHYTEWSHILKSQTCY
jgi:hypothetical protein